MSEMVKFASVSRRGAVTASPSVPAVCARAGGLGIATGTEYAVEGQYGSECTIGHENDTVAQR